MILSRTGRGYTKPAPGARINWGHPLARGLVGCWLLNEGSGLRVNDLVQGNHGLIGPAATLGAVWAKGHRGPAVTLDGTDDMISIPHHALFNVGGTFSVDAWVYPTSLAARVAVFSTRWANAAGSWQLEVGPGNGGTARVAVVGVGTFIFDSVNGVIAANTWTHIGYVRKDNNDTGTMYVNGVSVSATATAAYTVANNTDEKRIGSGTGAGQFFPGRLGSVRLSNVALTARDMMQLATEPYAFILAQSPSVKYFLPAAAGGIAIPVLTRQYRERWS